MKFLHGVIVAGVGFAVVMFGIFFYAGFTASSGPFSSPLPSALSKIFYPPQKTNKYWMPNTKAFASGKIETSAASALSYDLTTNTLLYSKNIDKKLPVASLTKIMTAIVALENQNENDEIVISRNAATIGEDSMGLSEGEKLTVRLLLYGLFLQSGNDAAEAIADASKYGRENFIHLMNKKAEDLGLSATHFTNPSGLEGDGKQYSTAHDLLVITRYALGKPLISEVVRQPYYKIPGEEGHKAYELYNETNLLTSYPGVKGVKTGFTNEAGLCLITYLEHKGHRIIAILLNSQNRRQEMKDLLDYSLTSLGVEPPQHD